MYNLLIRYSPAAWEGPEGEIELDRFYGGVLEPDGVPTGKGGVVSPETFQRLVGLPTLLMYEGGTPGGSAQIVRYGRIKNLQRYGAVLSFTFEPDAENGYLTRDQVMKFARHLDIGTANHTHWALKAGSIPPALIRQGTATAPVRSREELELEMEEAEEVSDEQLVSAVQLQLARLDSGRSELRGEPAIAASPVANMSDALSPPKSVVAFIVGIEKYNTMGGSGLNEVPFAAKDAQEFAECLRGVYGDALEEPTIYLNGEATQSTILNDLAYTIRNLGPDDLFIFYYAGHGFHGSDGNRLSAADSHSFSLENTTLSVREILIDPLRSSGVRRALAFIDACAVDLSKGGRDVVTNLDPAELKTFLTAASYSAIFLSCRPGEQSWSTPLLKNGIWTYHLLKALNGEAPEAVGHGGYVTDASLKDYLAMSVPAYIRDHTTIRAKQTPQAAIAATNTFAIRKVDDPVQVNPATLPNLGLSVSSQILEGRSYGSLKRLPDWHSGLRIPDRDNPTSRAFVESLIAPKISDQLQEYYLKTKDVFGLPRREIRKEEGIASGALHTDAFRYSIEGGLDGDDLGRYEIIHWLEMRRTDADTLTKVDTVFGRIFEAVVGELDDPGVVFDDVVDVVEALHRALGGDHTEDSRVERASYTAPGGGVLTIDLSNRELRLTDGGRATATVILEKAKALNQTVSAASGPPQVAGPPPIALPKL